MANVIKLKRSGTVSSSPTSLEHGELAINYADGKIFYKDNNNVINNFSLLDSSGAINIDGGSAATIYSYGGVDEIDGGDA
jgi:hypothetical protein